MATRVTLTLPDEVYQQAEQLAQITHREVAEVLAATIALSLPPLSPSAQELRPVAELSDQAVLELAETRMAPAQGRRLSRLLDKQQAGQLSEGEQAELGVLLQAYQLGLLQKAQALREAVRRGLRPPLER
jgi:hypothetical protein